LTEAERVVAEIEDNVKWVRTLGVLVQAYAQAQQLAEAGRLLCEAKRVAVKIEDYVRAQTLEAWAQGLEALVQAYAQAQQFDAAERVAAKIEDDYKRVQALEVLVQAYAQARR
jgi:hypothetical protein